MEKDQYEDKLVEFLQSDQFKAINNTDELVVLKIEETLTKSC